MIALVLLAQISCTDGGPSEPATQSPRPPASAGHAMVYHDSLGAVLLLNTGLGGMHQPPATTRTVLWKWTGQTWQVLDSLGPPVRNLAGVAYDALRNRMVMHGGSYDRDLAYDETWEWSPANGWQQRAATGPGRRDHVEMAWDAARHQVVLFGGQIGADSFPTDTWTWNGSSWTRSTAAGPAGRVHYSLLYDPAGQRILLFGGHAPDEHTNKGDTWAWNGSSWSRAAAETSPRTHARLGLTGAGVIVLGGLPAMAVGSVLTLSGNTWQPSAQPNAPSARYLTAMAYDPGRKVTVLFGGGDPASDRLYGDTWEYSLTNGWRRVGE